jgi:[histone H3]-dimethyl-L-lysine9 demethylase
MVGLLHVVFRMHFFSQVLTPTLILSGSPIERMRIVTSDGTSHGAEALHPELQFARCMSNRYKTDQFPRCVSCTRRWAGDTCRFQGIRFFLKDVQRNIVGISFVESQKADSPTMDFPSKWNIELQPSHIRRTKVCISRNGWITSSADNGFS